jgi:MFS family permease
VVFMYATRFIAGAGIGGEYAAINSAIEEMIPSFYRGRVDVAVNGTYWGGAILGTLGSLLLLHAISPGLGWRLGFLLGPVLAFVILLVRRNLPESPRWQLMHGKEAEAEASIRYIEPSSLAALRSLVSPGQRGAPLARGSKLAISKLTEVATLVFRPVQRQDLRNDSQ